MITVSNALRHACLHACMQVVAGLIDTPHMRHEVARRRYENASCGSVVGAAVRQARTVEYTGK